uniref:Uncharacterized protein n=1 Tax=Anguilla anguilla TaxID=7936 RepID=A0A0E9TYA4_ANGAN
MWHVETEKCGLNVESINVNKRYSNENLTN